MSSDMVDFSDLNPNCYFLWILIRNKSHDSSSMSIGELIDRATKGRDRDSVEDDFEEFIDLDFIKRHGQGGRKVHLDQSRKMMEYATANCRFKPIQICGKLNHLPPDVEEEYC